MYNRCCICDSRVQTYCDPKCLLQHDEETTRHFYCLMDGRNCFSDYHGNNQDGVFPYHSSRGLCQICKNHYSRYSCSKCGKRICLFVEPEGCFYSSAHLDGCTALNSGDSD